MIDEFEKMWGKVVPVGLRQLIEFQEEESDFESYSQGFGVSTQEKSRLEHGWSNHPDFLAKLYPFAQANGSGAIYAIWDNGEGYPMDDMPVVVFGDEGGQWVVAEYFSKFLQLLTFDAEISVSWDYCFFYKDEDDDYQSPDAEAFREWFSEHHDYLPCVDSDEEAEAILENAQQKNQQKFNDWLSSFGLEVSEFENSEDDDE